MGGITKEEKYRNVKVYANKVQLRLSDFDGSLDRAISVLQEAYTQAMNQGLTDIVFESQYEYCDDTGPTLLFIAGTRPENHEERKNRLSLELSQEERERREYERLKAKFEKENH